MKKTLIALVLAVLALGTLSVGVAFAKGNGPGNGNGTMGGGTGLLTDYMDQAKADALGISLDEFQSRIDAGETFYQIALSEGFTVEQFPALMQDARIAAVSAAVADGVITDDQADWMSSRGAGRNGTPRMNGTGTCDGTCVPLQDGSGRPADQPAGRGGPRSGGNR
jgi:hypothetical protein